nr:MAG TPA: hypothetical protein [Caudoviricetes sp.]
MTSAPLSLRKINITHYKVAALPVCPFIVCNNTPKTKTKK